MKKSESEQKELYKITKENETYILYVYGEEYMKSTNVDLLTAEIFRIRVL